MRIWLLQFLLLLIGIAAASAADPVIPHTNGVVRYQWERAGPAFRSTDIPKFRGDALLAMLKEGRALEEQKLPPGVVCAIPAPADWWLVVTSSNGQTARLGFTYSGWSVHLSNRVWMVKAAAREDVMWMVAMLEDDWRRDIVAAPRPCVYAVGTLRDGGTLSSVARMFYGDTNKWREIYDANRQTITNSDVVGMGIRLTIP